MNILTSEQWGEIVDYPMWAGEVWECWFDARWLVEVLEAKYDLMLLRETGCLDSGLL